MSATSKKSKGSNVSIKSDVVPSLEEVQKVLKAQNKINIDQGIANPQLQPSSMLY